MFLLLLGGLLDEVLDAVLGLLLGHLEGLGVVLGEAVEVHEEGDVVAQKAGALALADLGGDRFPGAEVFAQQLSGLGGGEVPLVLGEVQLFAGFQLQAAQLALCLDRLLFPCEENAIAEGVEVRDRQKQDELGRAGFRLGNFREEQEDRAIVVQPGQLATANSFLKEVVDKGLGQPGLFGEGFFEKSHRPVGDPLDAAQMHDNLGGFGDHVEAAKVGGRCGGGWRWAGKKGKAGN